MTSVIDQPLTLRELLDVDGIREVCKSLAQLYGVGIKVFDAEGTKLVDIRTADVNLTGYLFSMHATQVMFTGLVQKLKAHPLQARRECVVVDDFVGLRYSLLPVAHEGAVVGRLIFGPFAPPGYAGPPDELKQKAPELDLAQLSKFIAEIPRASDDQITRVLLHVRSVLDVIIHASFKTLMTSRVHIAGMTGAFEELERSNRDLRRANEQLRELDRLKSNFIATVSHELRTPLTSVIGYSEMLLENMAGELKSEQRDYVKTILEKGESLLQLIGQVLDLSRIESGNVTIAKELTEPAKLLELCVSDVMPQAQKREVKVVVHVEGGVEPIAIDGDKIRRVIVNLLGNAVKFTPAGGTIDVKVSVDDRDTGKRSVDIFRPELNRSLRIDVVDTGIGIPEDKLDRVFDSFFQVDNSSTRQFGGTGLGLSIARNFVQAHAGRIEVRSTLGKGSTFSVFLPYVVDESVDAPEGTGEFEAARL